MHFKRFNIDGHARFLTFSCFKNRPFLKSPRACRWFIESLESTRDKYAFELWSYVLMPNHVHLFILPKHGNDVPQILMHCKRRVTDFAKNWMKENNPAGLQKMLDLQPSGDRSFRFWQRGGGYDRNIFTNVEVHEKIRYIHGNPVRAKLTEHPGNWEWSSFAAWENGTDKPISIDRDNVPLIEK